VEQEKRSKRANLVHSLQKWKKSLPHHPPSLSKLLGTTRLLLFFLAEGAYAQQGRARIRRLRPDEAALAHSQEVVEVFFLVRNNQARGASRALGYALFVRAQVWAR
jgi:hypothetical protein